MYGADGVNGQGFGGFEDIFSGFGDFFGDFFGGGQSSTRRRYDGPIPGSDIEYRLDLEFMESIFGAEKEVTIRRVENCKTCDASGAKPGTSKETCPVCHGSGEQRVSDQGLFGQVIRVTTCSNCQGNGEIIEEKCEDCQGLGEQTTTKKVKVKIPAGVNTGSIISLRGEGNEGKRGGPSGNLYIYIKVREHEQFKREGNDIYYTMPISFVDASLGAKLEIALLDDVIEYKIPAGTQTGTVFKIENEGVEDVHGRGKGDLYFEVQVIVPKKLSKKQKELLKEFKKESNGEEHKSFLEKIKESIGL